MIKTKGRLRQNSTNQNNSAQNNFSKNKSVVLILDVSESLFDFIRSKACITKLNRRWKVKWRQSKIKRQYTNKVYRKVENFEDYLDRKRLITLQARKRVSCCYDFRCHVGVEC